MAGLQLSEVSVLPCSYLTWEKYQERQGEKKRREERKEGGRKKKGGGGELSVCSAGSVISFLTAPHALFDQLLKFLCASYLAFN